MLVTFLVVLHVLFSLTLIGFVLMHRGQGGGLSDMFGGGGAGGAGGSAVVERNLDRLTVIVAILFVITNCLLVVLL